MSLSSPTALTTLVLNMKTFRTGGFYVFMLVLLGGLQACSNHGGVTLDTTSFKSGPPELKDKWSLAAQYAARRNYLGAATNLMAIFDSTNQLTTEQSEALNQAWLKLGNAAFAAADKGDQAATEAVLKMKGTGIGERRGRP